MVSKMAEELVKTLNETIEHADQLFDENNFQEAYDLLQKFPVSMKRAYLLSQA